jgi:hypothetical protein
MPCRWAPTNRQQEEEAGDGPEYYDKGFTTQQLELLDNDTATIQQREREVHRDGGREKRMDGKEAAVVQMGDGGCPWVG